MNIATAMPILFWVLLVFRLMGQLSHTLYKREQLLLDVIIDAIGLLTNVTWFIIGVFGLWPSQTDTVGNVLCAIFTIAFIRWLRNDYRKLRDFDDDDDEPRGRRRIRETGKNLIPKPHVDRLPVMR